MDRNQIITLITDWGLQDHYLAMAKGRIWSLVPNVNIVDITHSITSYDFTEAAFILRNCYRDFPEGTIHIIAVAAKSSYDASHLVVKHENQYFIGTNNGFFSFVFDTFPDEIWELNTHQQEGILLYPSRDIYAPTAAALAKGISIEKLAHQIQEIETMKLMEAYIRENTIRGRIIHIDHYENAYTNITRNLFEKVATPNQPFKILFKTGTNYTTKLSNTFSDVKNGRLGLLFTTDEYLTIIVNQGNAAGLFGLNKDDEITLIF